MAVISNSTLPKTMGAVNGFGQSLVSLARSFAPSSGASVFFFLIIIIIKVLFRLILILLKKVFAFSVSNNIRVFPFNHYLVFLWLMLLVVALLFLSFKLPESI